MYYNKFLDKVSILGSCITSYLLGLLFVEVGLVGCSISSCNRGSQVFKKHFYYKRIANIQEHITTVKSPKYLFDPIMLHKRE